MSTNRRGRSAVRPHTLCASTEGASLSQAKRGKAKFTLANQALLAVIGLLTTIAATHAHAASLRPSPIISALELAAPVGIVGPDAVLPLAPFAIVDFAPPNVQVGETSLMTITLINQNQAGDIVGVQLADDYPTGFSNYGGGPVIGDSCGFTEDVSAANSVILTNGTIPSGGSCGIVIEVVGTAPNIADNHTGVISSSNAPDGADASATLTVGLPAPSVAKSFDPGGVYLGGTSRMTITLTNPNSIDAITGARFTDDYPMPLGIANASDNTVVSNTCDGNLDAAAGGSTVALLGGTIPANGSCSVVINVVGANPGFVINHTGAVDSDNALSGADATGVVVVNNSPLVSAPGVTESFTPATVGPNGTSEMTITFTNPNAETIFGVQLDDLYPTGLINANSLNPIVSDTCNFNHDVPSGGAWARLSGGTIPVGPACSIVIDVVADVMASTTLTSTTSTIVSGNAEDAGGATAVLTVDASAPAVTCVLPTQVGIIGDFVSIDLASLFMPPPGWSLIYSVSNPPPGLSIAGSLLTGTLATAGTSTSTLTATSTGPGGVSASEDVMFEVLPLDELVFRDGFGDPVPQCQ
jgi:hypothetical protein